jgi:hypothetical protein
MTAEDLTHIERFDANGMPTGRAWCGFPSARFATATWWADCEACIRSVEDYDVPNQTERPMTS